MKIDKVIVKGFRSFKEETTIDLGDVTGAIGGNGTGKSSFLLALNKLFGLTQKDRTIKNEDFFVQPGENIDDVEEREILIEVKLTFPELVNDEGGGTSIPSCFQNMVVDASDSPEPPYCRVRLTSTYSRDQLGDGYINTKVSWVKTPYNSFRGSSEEILSEFRHTDRDRIKVIYVPAARDPYAQLQEFSGSLIGKFVKSINWSSDPETTLKSTVQGAKSSLAGELGVKVINQSVEKMWGELSPSFRTFRPRLSFIDDDVKKMLKNVTMEFEGDDQQRSTKVQDLSDGEKSLFYFSLLKSALDLKGAFLKSNNVKIEGSSETEITINELYDSEKLNLPSLTILAIEEPENHLSPHHFGYLVESFKQVAAQDSIQTIFSSHSPSIISRVNPEDIRYLKLKNGGSNVKRLLMPKKDTDAFTYVKEAVRSYPELYFSKLVVLGEGDSEEVILKRLMEARGLPLDRTHVSIVPLGGRYVNHFWRLLNDLEIPFVTLLDLDLGKDCADWDRIKYCIRQLIEIGYPLETIDSGLSDTQLNEMHTWKIGDGSELMTWVNSFEERFGVFFSSPLDIDYMMLESFLDEYKRTISPPDRGPTPIPKSADPNYSLASSSIVRRVFGEWDDACLFYDLNLLNYYKYFFLSKGKPLTHKVALSYLSNEELIERLPNTLKRLLDKVELILRNLEMNDDNGASIL